jgi:hypothetical protein
MRTELSATDARAILESGDHDAYGTTRLYGTYGPDSVYAGQISAIKSTYQLEQLEAEGYADLYAISRDSVPIRRA